MKKMSLRSCAVCWLALLLASWLLVATTLTAAAAIDNPTPSDYSGQTSAGVTEPIDERYGASYCEASPPPTATVNGICDNAVLAKHGQYGGNEGYDCVWVTDAAGQLVTDFEPDQTYTYHIYLRCSGQSGAAAQNVIVVCPLEQPLIFRGAVDIYYTDEQDLKYVLRVTDLHLALPNWEFSPVSGTTAVKKPTGEPVNDADGLFYSGLKLGELANGLDQAVEITFQLSAKYVAKVDPVPETKVGTEGNLGLMENVNHQKPSTTPENQSNQPTPASDQGTTTQTDLTAQTETGATTEPEAPPAKTESKSQPPSPQDTPTTGEIQVISPAALGQSQAGTWETFTEETLPDHKILNSVTNNPEWGDERQFLQITDLSSGVSSRTGMILESGKTYEITIYIRNGYQPVKNLTWAAQGEIDVRLVAPLPTELTAGVTTDFTASLIGEDASPNLATANLCLLSREDLTLQYVDGSASRVTNSSTEPTLLDYRQLLTEHGYTFKNIDRGLDHAHKITYTLYASTSAQGATYLDNAEWSRVSQEFQRTVKESANAKSSASNNHADYLVGILVMLLMLVLGISIGYYCHDPIKQLAQHRRRADRIAFQKAGDHSAVKQDGQELTDDAEDHSSM